MMLRKMLTERGADLTEVIKMQVLIDARSKLRLSEKEKLAIVKSSLPYSDMSCELIAGDVLQKMVVSRDILGWFPTEKASLLDQLMVDCVVCTNDRELVPLQITSEGRHGNRRRKQIGKLLGDRNSIGVLQITQEKLGIKNESEIMRMVEKLISSTSQIKVPYAD